MERIWPVEIGAYPESRVRALGFDPGHLTPEEQAELVEWYDICPDEAREGGGGDGVVVRRDPFSATRCRLRIAYNA